MLNIKNTIPLAAVLGGLLIFFAAPVKSSAADRPTESFRNSCQNVKVTSNHIVTAKCPKTNGKYEYNKIRFLFLCVGDISNQDGWITCNKDPNGEAYQNALNTFSAASVIVLGRNPTSEFSNDFKDQFDPNVSELMKMLSDFFDRDNTQNYYDGSIKLSTAVALVKRIMHERKLEGIAINNAYQQVYKRSVEVDDLNRWMSSVQGGTQWYSTIVLQLQKEKNQKK